MMLVRLVKMSALLSSGLLAGAFGYGAVNVATTFNVVPLDVRLTFHTALMRMNGPVIQTTMALAILSAVALAFLLPGRPRLAAASAGVLTLASFLITRFGNVPINGQIKVWAVSSVPADHAAILQRWEAFNIARTATAFVAFVLVIVVIVHTVADRLPARQPN
jgi:hypothetical protein